MKILEKAWGGFARGVVKTVMRVVYRPDVVFEDKEALLTSDRPLIFISNHTSCLDPLLLLTVLKGFKPYSLAAKDWFEKKSLHCVMEQNRCIPVDRYNLDTSWLRRAKEVIGERGSIIIFPEGHTEKTEETDEFKSGFLMLAIIANARIVPVWHSGYRMFRKTKAVISAPQDFREGTRMVVSDLKNECERFRDCVIALGEEYAPDSCAAAKEEDLNASKAD